ncbi:hypothetical protein Tco_0146834 [Tanacetum coccineum]
MNHQTSSVPQVIPQVAPPPPTQHMTESPFIDSGFVVPVFSPEDDLIACLNKAMAFLIAVSSSRQELLNATTAKVKDIWLGNALSLSDQNKGMQHGIRKKAKAQGYVFQKKEKEQY